MAVSDRGGTGWSGTSYTLDAAKATAMAECQQVGENCKVVASGSAACFAVAGNTLQYYGGYGATQDDAEQQALTENGGGTILSVRCT